MNIGIYLEPEKQKQYFEKRITHISIKIVTAGSDNATVIFDKDFYSIKLNALVTTNNYTKLLNDPT